MLACPCVEECRLWVHPCSSSSVQHVLFILFLEMGGKLPYNCCFMKCCFQDLFNIAHSILMQFPSSILSVSIEKYWHNHCLEEIHFILSNRSNFHISDSLSIAIHTFAKWILTLVSVDETLLLRYVNLSTNFRGPQFTVEMGPSHLKHIYSVLFAFMWRPIPPTTCSRLYNRDLAWVGVFLRSTRSCA